MGGSPRLCHVTRLPALSAATRSSENNVRPLPALFLCSFRWLRACLPACAKVPAFRTSPLGLAADARQGMVTRLLLQPSSNGLHGDMHLDFLLANERRRRTENSKNEH